jgi:ribonuclease Z
VIRPDLVSQIPAPRLQDILDYHSSCEDAGRTAAAGGVGTLVLTHPVPPPAPGTEDEWVAQAAAHFDGEIILAADLTTISV